MDNLHEIENFLEHLAEEIEPHLTLIPQFLSTIMDTNKPLSIFSATSIFQKIESIRLAIFELAKFNEYYSINILLRSLIEHYIKFQYIWMKAAENDNDEIGIDYLVFGGDQENIDYVKALSHSYSLVGIEPEISPVEVLKKMGILSGEKSANLIRKKTEQFKYKNMTHYIAEELRFKETGEAPLYRSFFPLYSRLSCCVHGGPEMYGEYDLMESIELSTFASLYARWSTLILFYQHSESVEPLCRITYKYLQKFTGYKRPP